MASTPESPPRAIRLQFRRLRPNHCALEPVSQGLRSFVQQHQVTVIGEDAVAAAAGPFFDDSQVYEPFDPFRCGGERELGALADVIDRCNWTDA
jgi:hypothetical protein